MTPDLKLLIWTVGLTFVQLVIATVGAITQAGLPKMAGNREPAPEFTGWVGRAVRAHRNMLESLVLFAILVLVAAVAGKANAMTAMGAHIFFAARLIYVPVYLIGIPWVRTLVWAGSATGLAMIFLQLI